ncbi:murein biosynthesis integral membrane protein MurJ [Myceligenerans pegani]|uniref:Virulence factor MviN n=1 Tax=Myceligenerans pegani TaxID=2776917 RepID=A0ABR9N5H5_9MICO|nr:lipid II flippase MurJ [Myceligenerans sp. TRM 65318]MBE1878516.1 virulence factor MviN [Myceligenerans sp. TRM 65318]MBE3020787.1 virulence factor MviN [Myceligenerans sp. TRM 65318]
MTRSGLARAALLVTLVTLASRIVGFGRWLAQGYWVGNGTFTDAFNAANLLPNVLFEVAAGGALAGAVVPLVSGPLSRGTLTGEGTAAAREQASRSASALLGWTLVVLVPAGGVMALLAGPLANWLVDDPLTDVVAAFLRVFAVQVPMYGIAVVLGGMLQAHKRFFWPAFSPLISSVVVIGVYWGYAARLPERGAQDLGDIPARALDWLAWGITAGVVALALPLVLPALRTGLRLRPTLRFPDGEGRRAAHLAFAGVGALVAQQLALVVVMKVGTDLGGYTTWLYAYNVYLLPYAVLAFPIATSAFPHFTDHAAAGRLGDLRGLVASTTRTLLVVAAAGVAALAAAAPAVETVFDLLVTGDAPGMASALAWMAPGLVGYALVLHLSRALYAVDHGRAAVVATATGWGVMVLGLLATWVAFGGPGGESAGDSSGSPGAPSSSAGFLDGLAVLDGERGPGLVLGALGVAGTLGMTVAGAGLLIAVRRHLGRAALAGTGRTGLVLAAGTALGALAGYGVGYLLRPPGQRIDPGFVAYPGGDRPFVAGEFLAALGSGLLAGVVAVVVVLALAALADSGLRARLRAWAGRAGR